MLTTPQERLSSRLRETHGLVLGWVAKNLMNSMWGGDEQRGDQTNSRESSMVQEQKQKETFVRQKKRIIISTMSPPVVITSSGVHWPLMGAVSRLKKCIQ